MAKKILPALALCAALGLSACSSTEQMPDDLTHRQAAEATASADASASAESSASDEATESAQATELSTVEYAVSTGAVVASQLGFPNSAKITGEDLQQLAQTPTDTLDGIVVLPAQCSQLIEELNWSPLQLGTDGARTDLTDENQSITGSIEVAAVSTDGDAATVASHYDTVQSLVSDCPSVKLEGMDYSEQLKFSDPGIDTVDSALYFTRDGDDARNSLVLIAQSEDYVAMVSFVSTAELNQTQFYTVATGIMDSVLSQLP